MYFCGSCSFTNRTVSTNEELIPGTSSKGTSSLVCGTQGFVSGLFSLHAIKRTEIIYNNEYTSYHLLLNLELQRLNCPKKYRIMPIYRTVRESLETANHFHEVFPVLFFLNSPMPLTVPNASTVCGRASQRFCNTLSDMTI